MTLLQKLNKELEKVNLVFIVKKEFNEKFKGVLKDTTTNYEIKFEIWKTLQNNYLKDYSKYCRNYVDTSIKCEQMMKEGK